MAVRDNFANDHYIINNPGVGAFEITPGDVLRESPRMLYIGSAGNVEVEMLSKGTVVVFMNVPDGTFLPIRVASVLAGSTTADNILGIV